MRVDRARLRCNGTDFIVRLYGRTAIVAVSFCRDRNSWVFRSDEFRFFFYVILRLIYFKLYYLLAKNFFNKSVP